MAVQCKRPRLYNLTNELIWPAVIARTKTHPHEVAWQDNNGGTALHHSCRFEFSTEVVREMLSRSHSAACIQDVHGSTPLHIACWNGASEIVRLLVDAHRAAASYKDKKGRTPLHVACSSCPTPSVDTIQALLKADPNALMVVDRFGNTPLSILCKRHEARMKIAAEHIDRGSNSDDVISGVLRSFWTQLCLLLDGNIPNDRKDLPFVHVLTTIPDCPRVLFELAVKLHPDQVKEQVYGSFPLHLAAECPCTSDDEHKDGYYICSLLSLFPVACQIPDRAGRLPLHIATEAGKSWDAAVKKLFEAFPSAIMMRDGKHSLFPFMIAAMPKPNPRNLKSLKRDVADVADVTCQQMTTTYELLLADPSMTTHQLQ